MVSNRPSSTFMLRSHFSHTAAGSPRATIEVAVKHSIRAESSSVVAFSGGSRNSPAMTQPTSVTSTTMAAQGSSAAKP